ncbi:MAG: phosphotransferase [Bacteroidales bacterium]|nr:phosphotransferase [Bacteroidales bacterium]
MVKVSHAVILAAGAATRFVPLSLEQPKGLFSVNGERLIDRQIEQLLEAGIKDITVVLGYKKEMFFYLREKYGVRLIDNPQYNTKNNIQSLLCARDYLEDAYICSSDDYFSSNPFRSEEPFSFYAGESVDYASKEMFVKLAPDGRIIRMEKGLQSGQILLGHSFWTAEFARKFNLIALDDKEGKYDQSYWEWLVRDYLSVLPPLHFKEYPKGVIYEFDYFEELRRFDSDYVAHAKSHIIDNIKSVFKCQDSDVTDFRKISEGLTNTSFIFRIDGKDYIYRHPGDGTEKIIDRHHERTCLEKARSLGIDPTYIYMDVDEGWKISSYVPAFREPDYSSEEDTRRVLGVLRRLHASPVKVDWGLRPWEDSLEIEKLLIEKAPDCFKPYEALKERIGEMYRATIGDGVQKCFCHADTYKHNWMFKPDGDTILIDWEYAGYSDPGIDVGYYIVDAMYDRARARSVIRDYLREDWTPAQEKHYLVYTALIAWYWFVWALYRESCGASMGESLGNWLEMAKYYAWHA